MPRNIEYGLGPRLNLLNFGRRCRPRVVVFSFAALASKLVTEVTAFGGYTFMYSFVSANWLVKVVTFVTNSTRSEFRVHCLR
jgi:hypothetical protein